MDPDPSEPSTSVADQLTARHRVRAWMQKHDPGLGATKRSIKAAVILPSTFAIATYAVGNPQTQLFSVFGTVALLLFANFGGPQRVRLECYVALWTVGATSIVVATLCSTHAVLSVVAMAVVGFTVLFAGVISPKIVAGSTAALLTFVLPIGVPAPPSAIGDRLLGWALSGALCIPVALLVWVERWHDRLRLSLAEATGAVADLLEAGAAGHADPAVLARMDDALVALRNQYEATPYRPTGAGPTDVALTNLVSQIEWVGSRARDATQERLQVGPVRQATEVEVAAAGMLRAVAETIHARATGAGLDPSPDLSGAIDRLAEARAAATDAALAAFVDDSGGPGTAGRPTDPDGAAISLSVIDPTFRIRMLAFAVELLAEVAIEALDARRRDTPRVTRWASAVQSGTRVMIGHLTPGSVWLRNSVRGAVALAIAVAVIQVTSVQHGFWVVLGTLSVLRSNALGTGSTAVRAVMGTAAGFVIGSLILLALGHHDVLLWVVLPVAVLVAGVAPSALSFTAGQAGFTVMVVVVFNILDPVGSSVGLIRIEDVVLGTAVSVGVGLLFWPRGATAQLASALGQGYATATSWLVATVDQVAREAEADDSTERARAIGAAGRLDDAYRQYLTERGAKWVPLPIVTGLLTGCDGIRLTALTLEYLPVLVVPEGQVPTPEIVRARRAVIESCASMERWFGQLTQSLQHHTLDVSRPESGGDRLPEELASAWAAVRRVGRRDGLFAVLRLFWIKERLDDLRTLQSDLAGTDADFHRTPHPGP